MFLKCFRTPARYLLSLSLLSEQNIYFIQMRSHIENSMLWKLRSEMFYVNIVNIKTSRENFLTSWHADYRDLSLKYKYSLFLIYPRRTRSVISE